MINTRRIAEQIDRALTAAGLHVRENLSGLSSSRYLTVDRRDEAGDLVDSYRIRVANHDCKPTYFKQAPFNFDVGEHQDADGDWLDAVHHACADLDVEVPARIASRREKRIAAREFSRQLDILCWTLRREYVRQANERERAAFDAALNAVLPHMNDEDWALLLHVGTVKKAHTDGERQAREMFSQRCQRRGLVVDRYLRERLCCIAHERARAAVV